MSSRKKDYFLFCLIHYLSTKYVFEFFHEARPESVRSYNTAKSVRSQNTMQSHSSAYSRNSTILSKTITMRSGSSGRSRRKNVYTSDVTTTT